MSDEEDDLFDAVNAMAERIGLDGKDKQRYVHEHMTRAGYDAVPTYVRREEEGDDDRSGGSGFFGRDRSRRPSERPRPPRDKREDDWYTG